MPKQDQRTRLSRKDMEALIESGQSVIHDGQLITKAEDLPTDVDLALGDPDKENATEAEIDRQIKALQDAKTKLRAGKKDAAEKKDADKDVEREAAPRDEAPADDKNAKRAEILGGQTKPAK